MAKSRTPAISIKIQDFDDEIRSAYLALLPHQSQAVGAGKLDWKFRHNPAGMGKMVSNLECVFNRS
jgi:hypothetical protein